MRLCPPLGLTLATLLISVPAFAEDKPKAPPPARDEQPVDEEFQNPPPGASAEDQATWLAGQRVARDIHAARDVAVRLQGRAKSFQLLERLDAAAKGKPAEEAAAILALRTRVKDRWAENYAARNRRWPVDPIRGCGQALMLYDSALRAKLAKAPRADLGNASADLKTCIARSAPPIGQMTTSNEAFTFVMDEADKRLAELEPPRLPPAVKAGAAAAAKAPQAGAR